MSEKPKNEQKQLDDESEFGKGLSYCLGLFLAHAERDFYLPKQLKEGRGDLEGEIWFNGASDHLFELQVDSAPGYLQDRLGRLQEKCIMWGHGFNPEFKPTIKDKEWAIGEAKFLLLAIDKYNNIPTKRGNYE
jgi:hypothetical protein